RIQVEHTVTELVTGVDLVREQIRIAAGDALSFGQVDVRFSGHAIECRINAEDASNGFLPAPGVVTAYREPAGPGVRVDSGVEAGSEVLGLYDPLVAKLCVWDTDRESARRRMLRALGEFVIEGVPTLVGFHRALLEHRCFVEGSTCHGVAESEELAARASEIAPIAPFSGPGPSRRKTIDAEVDGRRYTVTVLDEEPPHAELARRRRERASATADGGGAPAKEALVSPMQGTVVAVEVSEGEEVEAGRVICVIEAMKMENEIKAHRHGVVTRLTVAPGEPVKSGQVICVVAADGAWPDV
ncbi:MAG: carbamoyl phosphate synthase, partial [Actinobacteria bacterium]|nr:carbamoyl phosphate synthase [Actinomycetota bacterium]